MFMKETVVNNQVGLHARPATFFIQKANEFKSSVWVEKDERRVNAKSLLGVLSLGIVKGTTINLIADGPDEEEAVNALVELINSDFSEKAQRGGVVKNLRRIARRRSSAIFLRPAPPGGGVGGAHAGGKENAEKEKIMLDKGGAALV